MEKDTTGDESEFYEINEWFVRDAVKDGLMSQMEEICKCLQERQIQCEADPEGVLSVLMKFMDVESFTEDELAYCIHHIDIASALEELISAGLVEKTPEGYKLKNAPNIS